MRIAAVSAALIASRAAAESPSGAGDALPPTLNVTAGYHADVAAFGIGAAWPLHAFADRLVPNRLSLLVEVDLDRWEGRAQGPNGNFLWDASVTPILRWRPWSHGALEGVFVQGGIGVHLLSRTSINTVRQFGTAFQFGERAALGVRFGAGGRFEASIFAQHVSNAQIKEPNDGMTLYGVALGIGLD